VYQFQSIGLQAAYALYFMVLQPRKEFSKLYLITALERLRKIQNISGYPGPDQILRNRDETISGHFFVVCMGRLRNNKMMSG
jgi:hypothetical protein